jgi:hypothetical protein
MRGSGGGPNVETEGMPRGVGARRDVTQDVPTSPVGLPISPKT